MTGQGAGRVGGVDKEIVRDMVNHTFTSITELQEARNLITDKKSPLYAEYERVIAAAWALDTQLRELYGDMCKPTIRVKVRPE